MRDLLTVPWPLLAMLVVVLVALVVVMWTYLEYLAHKPRKGTRHG